MRNIIEKILDFIGYKSNREKDLENFYYQIRDSLTSQMSFSVAHIYAFFDTSALGAPTLDEITQQVNSPVKLALIECFNLLNVYFNCTQKTINDIQLEIISEDYKSRPDLLIKLVLPRLILDKTLTRTQIKSID